MQVAALARGPGDVLELAVDDGAEDQPAVGVSVSGLASEAALVLLRD